MEEDEKRSFAELFRHLIEFELPPAKRFREILAEVLRRMNDKHPN